MKAGGHTGTGTLGYSSSSSWPGGKTAYEEAGELAGVTKYRAVCPRPRCGDPIPIGLGSHHLRVSTPHPLAHGTDPLAQLGAGGRHV